MDRALDDLNCLVAVSKEPFMPLGQQEERSHRNSFQVLEESRVGDSTPGEVQCRLHGGRGGSLSQRECKCWTQMGQILSFENDGEGEKSGESHVACCVLHAKFQLY